MASMKEAANRDGLGIYGKAVAELSLPVSNAAVRLGRLILLPLRRPESSTYFAHSRAHVARLFFEM